VARGGASKEGDCVTLRGLSDGRCGGGGFGRGDFCVLLFLVFPAKEENTRGKGHDTFFFEIGGEF